MVHGLLIIYTSAVVKGISKPSTENTEKLTDDKCKATYMA